MGKQLMVGRLLDCLLKSRSGPPAYVFVFIVIMRLWRNLDVLDFCLCIKKNNSCFTLLYLKDFNA